MNYYNPLIWIWRTHGYIFHNYDLLWITMITYYDFIIMMMTWPIEAGSEAHTLDAMHGRIQGALEHRPDRPCGLLGVLSSAYIYNYIYTCTSILLVCKCILLYIDTNIPAYHLISFTSSSLLYPLNSHCIYTPLNEMALLPKSRPTCPAFLRRAAPEPVIDDLGYGPYRYGHGSNLKGKEATRCLAILCGNKSPNSWVPQTWIFPEPKAPWGSHEISVVNWSNNARVTGRKQNAIALWFPWRSWQLHAFSAREGPTVQVCVSLAMFACVERETWEPIVILMCI